MKFNKYLFFISIFFIKIFISKCTLIFPIETLSEDNYIFENKTSHQGIIRNLLYKDIYTIFEIGTPIQKIPLFIKTRSIDFEITSLTIKKDNLLEYHLKYNLSSIFNKYNFYNEKKSLTFQTKGCINNHNLFSDHLLDCLSNDNVFFYEDKNFEKKIKFENFDFNLVKNKEENITGVLGIGLFDKSGDIEKSFIKLLKNKKIINNYNWYHGMIQMEN